ncbi:MAG: ADYC domain-containing protein [Kofleriaceae bacterium]
MRTIPVVLTLLTFSCGFEPSAEPPPDFVPYGVICRSLECGNSGEVGRNGLHEASLSGKWDDNKIYLETNEHSRAQIWDRDHKAYDLHVENSTLFGVALDGSILAHDHLRDATIHVWQGGSPLYIIRLGGARYIEKRVGGKVEVYEMFWQRLDGHEEGELCNVPTYPIGRDDMADMRNNEVVLFEGDRIHARTKTMSKDKDWDPDWFNFGCAGRTLAKLKINAQTTKDQMPGQGWERRQATLKMLCADYCGTGKSYTETGIPLVWNDGEYMPYRVEPIAIEARWTELGSICVNTPRLEEAIGAPIFQEMIADSCLPLTCNDPWSFGSPPPGPHDFSDGAEVISGFWQ